MSVRKALRTDSHLRPQVKPGKQALENVDRARILEDKQKVVDSLDLDGASAAELPDQNRWDYLLGLKGRSATLIAAEVHPATLGEVDRVIAKKQAALAYLKAHWKNGQVSLGLWYWIASGRSTLPPTSNKMRLLAREGIQFVGGHLKL